jgi:hypothetical protein
MLVVLAVTPICREGAPEFCSAPILRGEVSPFDGQVLTTEMAIEQSQAARHCDKHTEIHVKRVADRADHQKRLLERLHALDTASYERQVKYLTERIEEAQKASERPWYEHPLIWTTIGAAMAVGAMWGGAKIIQASAMN